jgi:hypothetical protein
MEQNSEDWHAEDGQSRQLLGVQEVPGKPQRELWHSKSFGPGQHGQTVVLHRNWLTWIYVSTSDASVALFFLLKILTKEKHSMS